jgi:cytochrome c peroxidase
MKTLKTPFLILSLGIAVAFTSCQVSDLESLDSHLDLPNEPFDYQIGVANEIPTLGRVLFYDPRLSANNAVSCASCHKQALAFSDNKKLSLGFNGESTVRNSMSIQNIVSDAFPFGVSADSTGVIRSTALFWDGRQQDITSMVLEPIQNHIEMGISDMDELMNKVQTIPDYKPLFRDAFGSETINKEKVATALSAFIVSIRSTQSRFDIDMLLTSGTVLSQDEFEGFNLFTNVFNCNSCHQIQQPFNGYQFAEAPPTTDPPAHAMIGFADIGLDENPTDEGALRTTGRSIDKGKFKVASLRNVGLSAPYMHDGRFNTLGEVLDHYSTKVNNSPNLHESLRDSNGLPKRLNMTQLQKAQLIAFLKSMSDYSMINDRRFSNPFQVR